MQEGQEEKLNSKTRGVGHEKKRHKDMSRQIYYKLGECWEAKQGGNYSYEVIEIEIGEDAWQGNGDMTETI